LLRLPSRLFGLLLLGFRAAGSHTHIATPASQHWRGRTSDGRLLHIGARLPSRSILRCSLWLLLRVLLLLLLRCNLLSCCCCHLLQAAAVRALLRRVVAASELTPCDSRKVSSFG
jgi:hypothetical protein